MSCTETTSVTSSRPWWEQARERERGQWVEGVYSYSTILPHMQHIQQQGHHVCVCVCVCVRMCVCARARGCVTLGIYIYTHTHIHIYPVDAWCPRWWQHIREDKAHGRDNKTTKREYKGASQGGDAGQTIYITWSPSGSSQEKKQKKHLHDHPAAARRKKHSVIPSPAMPIRESFQRHPAHTQCINDTQ